MKAALGLAVGASGPSALGAIQAAERCLRSENKREPKPGRCLRKGVSRAGNREEGGPSTRLVPAHSTASSTQLFRLFWGQSVRQKPKSTSGLCICKAWIRAQGKRYRGRASVHHTSAKAARDTNPCQVPGLRLQLHTPFQLPDTSDHRRQQVMDQVGKSLQLTGRS